MWVVADAVETMEVGGDQLSQFRQAGIGGIRGVALLDGADGGLADVVGRGEIRLADTEGNDAIGGGDEFEEASDARGGDEIQLGGYGSTSRGPMAGKQW